MPPEHVSQIKDRRSVGRASVEHSKYGLEELIQVHCRNYATPELQQGFPGIPPRVNDPSRKSCLSSSLNHQLLFSDSCSQCARLYSTLFSLLEMYVRRWSTTSRWERALDDQVDLAGNIPLSTHPKRLPGVAVL